MSAQIETIKESFPYPVIPKHVGLPTYDVIAAIHMKLKANAASISSTLGGGNHGLLGITVSRTTYLNITGHQFQAPTNPGALPTIPASQTGPQISEIVRQHKESLRLWREYNATQMALKQILLASFDEVYFKGLRDRHVGYQNSTFQHMMQHLYTNYGVITPTDLEDNDIRMREAFDANRPIEELFDQIEEAAEYAEATNAPYNTTQIVSRAYLLLYKTGLYNDACREWRKRTVANQTWANFKTDFTAAHRDLMMQRTVQPNPFQEANATLADFQERTNEIIDQMTNATVDTTAISTLTNQNETLSSQLANATTDLNTMKTLVETLCKQVQELKTGQSNPRRQNRNKNNKSYCWTHGRTRNNGHTSKTCRNQADGHESEATLDNKMGGSTRFCADV